MSSAGNIGSFLKSIRFERKMTLNELGDLCNVSISTLSKIENAQVFPSYRTLRKIAEGLDVSFDRLLNDKQVLSDLARRAVTRKNDSIWAQGERYDWDIYAGDLEPKAMVPVVVHVKAHKPPEPEDYSSHEGEEFIFLLSGKVKLFLEGYGPLLLSQGDGVYIDSKMRHSFQNAGRGIAQILSIYYDPKFELQEPKSLAKLLSRQSGRRKRPENPSASAKDAKKQKGLKD